MRSPKLTSAITAAAALLALAPAGALAAKNHHRHAVRNHTVNSPVSSGSCQVTSVTLHVEKHVLTAGESALAFGVAKCGRKLATGQTVTVYQRPAGASGFSTVGSATATDVKGGYSVPTGVLTSNTAFYAVAGSIHSVQRVVKVQAQVTLLEEKSVMNGVKTGRANAVTFNGTVNPAFENDEVVLQRQNLVRGVGWATISKPTKVGPEGKFSIKHTFVFPGASNIRVVLKRNSHNITSPSNELSFTISQAQNPALTIETETNPVPFESATTIHGEASGLANTPVTLLGHAVGGSFAPVAKGTTDGSGKYTFANVKPLVSMLYRVEAGGRKSAVLYEGVKYVLTAVPPATVQSGQLLSIPGTVSPVKPNHPVLLQKKNTFGPGFHTIGEAKVEPDGKYTITDTLFVPGAYTLRVKVPGDPENGASATAPFIVTVTPVSAATIPSAGTP